MAERKLDPRRARRLVLAGNALVAALVSACLLGVAGAGAGAVPAVGCMLVPGHGAWSAAPSARPPAAPATVLEPAVAAGTSAPLSAVPLSELASAGRSRTVCGHVR